MVRFSTRVLAHAVQSSSLKVVVPGCPFMASVELAVSLVLELCSAPNPDLGPAVVLHLVRLAVLAVFEEPCVVEGK